MKKVFFLLAFLFIFYSALSPLLAATDETITSPKNLKASLKGNAIQLKWDSASDGHHVGYLIKRSEDGANFESISFTQASVNTYSDNSVEKGKTYKYVVHARGNGNIESEPSNAVEIKFLKKRESIGNISDEKAKANTQKQKKPSGGGIPSPSDVSAEYNAKDKSVIIRWKYDYDKKIEGFNIHRSSSEDGASDKFKKIATLEQLDEKEYKDENIKKVATYYYYVEAFAGKNKSDRSELGVVNTEKHSGISGDTYLGFCVRENTFPVISANFNDGTVYMAAYSVPRSVWEMWMPFGTISTPPNYEAGSVYVDASICDSNLGTMYTLYCYNEKTKTLYVSLKKNETGSWESWKAITNIDLTNPFAEKDVRFGFSWAKKTHWMFAWDVKNGLLKAQALSSEDGLQPGLWGNPPRVEVPPNYALDAHVGTGSLTKDKNTYTYLFSFNPNDLTLYITGNVLANNNWEPYKVLANKSLPLPPNMKK